MGSHITKTSSENFRGGEPLTEKDSVFSTLFFPVGFAIFGASGVLLANFMQRKPLYAHMPKQLLYGFIGGTFGYYADVYFAKKWVERDAVIKHYIELHPEDFQNDSKKFSDIFDSWTPIR